MRPRRYFVANQVYFASARVREGLPFIPDTLMSEFVKGTLARAQELYPVTLCHGVFMGNHFHLLFVCKDPEVVKGFFCYVKTALAVGINKLTGHRGPVWQGRTDIPIVVTLEKAIEQIVYIYTNPSTANLVNSIEEYPGLSTWRAFSKSRATITCKWIKTSLLRRINRRHNERTHREQMLKDILDTKECPETILKFSPDEWLRCFDVTDPQEIAAINDSIKQKIKEKEAENAKSRSTKPMGAKKLIMQSIYKRFNPKKYERRVFCLSHDSKIRIDFIKTYKELVHECQRIYELWKLGHIHLTMPLGMFSPPQPNLAVALY